MKRKAFTILLLLSLSVFGPSIFGEDDSCSPIELDQGSGPVSTIEAYDQGATNTCYSHAGSVLLDSWLHQNGGDPSKKTSPLAMAIFNKASIQASGLGNISCAAIDETFDYGRCVDDVFNENLSALFDDPYGQQLRPEEHVATLLRLMDPEDQNGGLALEKIRFEELPGSQSSVLSMILEQREEVIPDLRPSPRSFPKHSWKKRRKKREFNEHMENIGAEINCDLNRRNNLGLGKFVNDSKQIIKALVQTSDKRFMKEFTKVVCGQGHEEIPKPHPKCKQMMRYQFNEESTPKKFANQIHELLSSSNPRPVGVGYCSRLFDRGPGHRGLKEGFLGFTSLESMNSSECGIHESVVIGRKRNPKDGKCYFKIRNSWGKTHDRRYTHPAWDSDNEGNIWVSEEDLTNNMGSLTYLE